MNNRALFIAVIFGLLAVFCIEAAAKGGKGNKAKEVKVKDTVEALEDTVIGEEPLVAAAAMPKIVRPANLRVLTAYDKCKMECKKVKEQEGLNVYVEQLKAEIAAAEASIAEQEAAAAMEGPKSGNEPIHIPISTINVAPSV